MNDILTEMKKNLLGINSRVNEAENQNSSLEYKEAKITQWKEGKEKRILKNEDKVRSLWKISSLPTFTSQCVRKRRESRN